MDEEYIRSREYLYERDIEFLDESKLPELSYYAREGDLEKVKYLVSQDADLNETYKCLSPLHFAIINNNEEIAIYLISKDADINETDNFGDNCLMMATDCECTEIMKTLISEGIDYQESMEHYKKMGEMKKYEMINEIVCNIGIDRVKMI